MKEQVAEIVAAYLRKNSVAPSDVPAVIAQVYQSLAGLGQPQPVEPEAPNPAVPIRRSVNPEYVVCLDCGAKAKMLRRHLASAHNMTPAEYRQRWKLPTDHPLVAPSALTQTIDSQGDLVARFYGNGSGSLRHRQHGGSRPFGGDH
jgi:predicted transcriptional regulator